jgi:SAM-dependent methyltransferase
MNSVQQLSSRSQTQRAKRVLNAGSGPHSARALHPVFCTPEWQQVRLDIDPESMPDVAGSLIDMNAFPAHSFDAVWSSHSLEHLYKHEVPLALAEFKRVLRPDGFALITCPDLEAVAELVVRHGLDHVAYTSPMGPITTLDMIFGHSASIARGKVYMSHNTGFTCARLGQSLLDAGFATVLAKREGFDLWAVGLMDEADKRAIQEVLHLAGLDMFEHAE